MNNQLTEIHLSRRLPYGVKFKHDVENPKEIEKGNDITTLNLKNINSLLSEVDEKGDKYFKPILRNLDSLTRDELIKHSCGSHVDWIISEISVNGANIDWDYIPYKIIKYLLENNFHIDEPEGTFIYAESLDVNPYN